MGRIRCFVVAVSAALLLAAGPAQASGRLVALGDSFSSGEGVPPFERGSGGCHRSPRAWPRLLAVRLRLSSVSLACSGARIGDVARAQVRSLAAAHRVSVVTLTVGGNDAGFAHVLTRCALWLRCDRYYGDGGRDRVDRWIDRAAARLPAAYRAIRRAAPGARLVVMDYPRLFPADPDPITCAGLSTIGPHEERYLNRKTVRLDAAIGAAARRAGATFVEAAQAFAGHEISCFGTRQYVNHLSFSGFGVSPYSFHPNAAGQARLARVAAAALGVR